jgi:hypothetical protein
LAGNFYCYIPVILISFLLGWFILPSDPRKDRLPFRQVIKQLDIPGILFFAASMVLLLWFLLSFKTKIHPLSGILGVILLAGFIYRELHVEKPFIQLRLFHTRPLLGWIYSVYRLKYLQLLAFFWITHLFSRGDELGCENERFAYAL